MSAVDWAALEPTDDEITAAYADITSDGTGDDNVLAATAAYVSMWQKQLCVALTGGEDATVVRVIREMAAVDVAIDAVFSHVTIARALTLRAGR